MTTQEQRCTQLSRRQALGLASAAVLVVAGCTSSSKNTELVAARDDLKSLLDDLADDPVQEIRLTSVARRIEIRVRELIDEHEEFLTSFDALTRERDVTGAQLNDFIGAYTERRKWLRDDLLRLQDELKATLDPEDWEAVSLVLNRASTALATKKALSES